MRFVVVYDACVLYPAPLRDFLVRLATKGLFAARWTDEIHAEWSRNLLQRRPELDPDQLPRTRASRRPGAIGRGYRKQQPATAADRALEIK